MKINENRVALEFASDLKYTEFCVLAINFLKNSLSLGEDDFFKIEISLREAINNAIIHGNKGDIQKRVEVVFEWNRHNIHIIVRDQNSEKVDFEKMVNELKNRELLSASGRGIMIIKSYMDQVEFFNTKSGSEIHLEKQLQ